MATGGRGPVAWESRAKGGGVAGGLAGGKEAGRAKRDPPSLPPSPQA